MQPVQLPEHRIETRRVADLVPADYNPRKISASAMEGLKKSLAEFGAVQPIVVNERTGHIVGGHQRVKAMAALGQVETTVIVVDLSLTREKALNVALNNPHISGEFDDGLGDLLDEINGEMPELFADLRLDELLAPVEAPKEGLTDPDDVPDADARPGDAGGGCVGHGGAPHHLRGLDRRRDRGPAARRREAAPDGHGPAVWGGVRRVLARTGVGWWQAGGRQGEERRPGRLARGVGAVPRGRGLRVARAGIPPGRRRRVAARVGVRVPGA
jgi:hypothetical protein